MKLTKRNPRLDLLLLHVAFLVLQRRRRAIKRDSGRVDKIDLDATVISAMRRNFTSGRILEPRGRLESPRRNILIVLSLLLSTDRSPGGRRIPRVFTS